MTCIRVPHYDDPTRQTQAYLIYWLLLLLHLFTSVIKYVSLFWTKFFWDKMTLLIILVVCTACFLQSYWIFDNEDTATEPEQEVFELWLHIELYFILSFVFGAALFALISKFKKPVLGMKSILIATNGHGDFMEYYGFQIDFTNTMAAPAFTGLFLGIFQEEGPHYSMATGYLCLAQTLFFFLAMFLTRVSE